MNPVQAPSYPMLQQEVPNNVESRLAEIETVKSVYEKHLNVMSSYEQRWIGPYNEAVEMFRVQPVDTFRNLERLKRILTVTG